MTSKSQTPARVAAKATQPKAANLSGPTLIGVMGAPGAFSALLRLSGGRVKQVTPGTRVSAGTVIAIDADGLVLQKNGRTRRLSLPGG